MTRSRLRGSCFSRPMANRTLPRRLAKRLGGDKAGLLAWLDATATQVRAELAAEEAKRLVAGGRDAAGAGESSAETAEPSPDPGKP